MLELANIPKALEESDVKDEIAAVKSAFGATNRARLINAYFSQQNDENITPSQAWSHVYRLLLWVDQTTGLGHCYESDKSQPGKPWYARSLAFHDWVSTSLETAPGDLGKRIDVLFLRAAEELAAYGLKQAAKNTAKAENQRKPYEGLDFPKPGDDPEFVDLMKSTIGDYFIHEPPPEAWNLAIQKIRQYLALQNKRKNLVGEGFEDVITQVIQRTCRRDDMKVFTRRALQSLPGFNRSRSGAKINKVDVAITRPSTRTLVTAKWSIRADREKQFVTDFSDYLDAESSNKTFEYVLITNEFDPARLNRACEQLHANNLMFHRVVHINTDAIKATYSSTLDGEAKSMRCVLKHIETGRLISLENWLLELKMNN